MELTIDVAVLLAVVVFLRARRKPLARTRSDAWLTVWLTLALGVLIAPTPFGRWILDVVGQLVQGVAQLDSP
ncbi:MULTISPECIES: hypothetical protein [Streptomyces]|jgi:hypothetical protein|uniref:hypothetical protein n=1 Tax=Streptomyces TaxID=1883 RepID=UPI000D3DB618|nr:MULTISPECIES: hypothetical protein [Streptomyces]MBY8342748.1 hypothetical protein [Streptomyces plumbidurans]PTM91728.1 hypothetical protein C7821_110189 [Streptomyces sp. VMFN-G11Ma]